MQMTPKAYAAHEHMIAPARPKSALWRLALGLLVALFVTLALTQLAFFVIEGALPEAESFALFAEINQADTPLGMLLLLTMVALMGLGAMVAAKGLHGRAVGTLFGPARLFWPQFSRVLAAVALLNLIVFALPPWSFAIATEPGLPLGRWLLLLPITVAALCLQVTAEEVLFRGYLQSQLAARLSHPAIYIVLPSALFALGHYAPDDFGANAILVALWAGVFGIAAADLTARSGSLGPAIAFHLINNFIAITLIAPQGTMSGLALAQYPFGLDDEAAVATLLPMDLGMLLVSWLAARLALRV